MWPLLVRFAPRAVVWLTAAFPARALPVTPVQEDTAALRARGLRSLDALTAASRYRTESAVRESILAFKYRYHPLLHRRLAAMIAAAMTASGSPLRSAVLCPVPCTWLRRHVRGYNQAEPRRTPRRPGGSLRPPRPHGAPRPRDSRR